MPDNALPDKHQHDDAGDDAVNTPDAEAVFFQKIYKKFDSYNGHYEGNCAAKK